MPELRQPKPWPMKWVALAIVIFALGYTQVMLRYRKPGPAHEPYKDAVNRATVSRLLNSGYQRVALAVERPADPLHPGVVRHGALAATRAIPGGLPPALAQSLVEKPLLAEAITDVTAETQATPAVPYRIQFSATLADHKRVIAEAHLLRRDDTLVILPVFEKISGALQSRWNETTVLLTLPTGALPAGRYTATLVGTATSRTWTLEVK
ncbi:MAG: hypothetical protein HZA31_04010 [Opitutae bacterium]|nr:hypothetical protein [Opitutae bacterium]